jgi:cytochrome c peroxidase
MTRRLLAASLAPLLIAMSACSADSSATTATPTPTSTDAGTTPPAPTTPTTPVASVPAPTLPATSFSYSDAANPLPAHFVNAGAGPAAAVSSLDNTPAANPITDAGATLGRVLFYDKRLSGNDAASCSSCHMQALGFADTAQLSRGFKGGSTGRHSMGLSNARFYANGHFFWDERAATLEDQVLRPIQDTVEMGMTLPALTTKLAATSFYPALFQAAFGTADVTSDRISRALAQFVRSLVSSRARLDAAFAGNGPPNFAVLTADEQRGQDLFTGSAGCARCHSTVAQIADQARNTGLDATITDVGSGNGRFKAPSLRNVGVRGRFMHDGRFTTLEQVVDFYNSGVQNNPNLDQRLRAPGGQPLRLNLSDADKRGLVAFLRALTDTTFLKDPRFADPFPKP